MAKPTFIPPMLATLVAAPFDDPDWLFEVKWDGFRVEAVVDGGKVALWTRGEQDAARYFGPFLDPATWLDARDAVVDGEVIALDEHGEPDFALLQARIKARGTAAEPNPFLYEVFDLLHVDGRSLLDEPLEERRRLLASILRADPRVRLSEHIEAAGIAYFEAARIRGLEGIMAKDRRSPYVPGKRTDRWQKVKIRPEQELVVGGWVTGTGTAVDLGRAPGRRLRGRRAPVRGQGRCRVHRRPPVPSSFRGSPRWRPRRHPSVRPFRARPLVARTGCVPSSSSAPSSPAGPVTAPSDRRRTRASSSRRIHARSSASARRRRGRQEATMSRVRVAGFSVSIDGFGAGPDQSLDAPLGRRGEELHEWIVHTRMFHAMTGEPGGSTDVDDGFAARSMAGIGAFIMGRNMFGADPRRVAG